MRIAIMQPYLFPYLGYFQLIGAVDRFVVYDNIKYTKKGWINRNRFLKNGRDALFSVPLKGASDVLDVRERELAEGFDPGKLLNQLQHAYRRAPQFGEVFPLVRDIVEFGEVNLFRFLHNSVVRMCDYLQIGTEIVVSSTIPINHALKKEEKVLAICQEAGAGVYVNAIGGIELYSKETFQARGIELKFLRPKPFRYRQFDNEFVEWLSIIDVLMFNSKEVVRECLASHYDLI